MMKKNSKKSILKDYKKTVFQYETVIYAGAFMAILSFLNVIKVTNIPSDFFWTVAGIGLVIEGFLARSRARENRQELLERDKMFLRRK